MFGRWETQPCEGADDQCYAVPGKPSVVSCYFYDTQFITILKNVLGCEMHGSDLSEDRLPGVWP